jgi:L-ascorbate metabolism protein UlaG (beta-lactamase superfamily)
MATRLRWLGHSALWIETDGKKLLIDPFLTGNPVAVEKAENLQPDCILVTHGHFDHVGDTVGIAQRTGATVVANYEIAEWLGKQGVTAHGMQPGGTFRFPFGRVKLTTAIHGSALPDGSNGGIACGIHLFLNDGTRIFDAGDTALFGDMRLIGEDGIDLACLPIGDNFTMGPDDSIRAVKLLQPRMVMPIHYNTFELINQDAAGWAGRVRSDTQATPHTPELGGWIELS